MSSGLLLLAVSHIIDNDIPAVVHLSDSYSRLSKPRTDHGVLYPHKLQTAQMIPNQRDCRRHGWRAFVALQRL